jgi:hypothetical protein
LYSASYGVVSDIVVDLRTGFVGKTCAGGVELAGML